MRVAYPLETTGYDAVIAGILLNNAPALLEAIKVDSKGSDVPSSIFSVAFDYRTLGEGYYWQAYFTTVLENGAHNAASSRAREAFNGPRSPIRSSLGSVPA